MSSGPETADASQMLCPIELHRRRSADGTRGCCSTRIREGTEKGPEPCPAKWRRLAPGMVEAIGLEAT